jgi:hypothetical protein
MLLDAKVHPAGVAVRVLVSRAGALPRMQVELKREHSTFCFESLPLGEAVPFEELMNEPAPSPELARLVAARAFHGLVAVRGVAAFDSCSLDALEVDPVLFLVGGLQGHDRVTLSRDELRAMGARRQEALGYVAQQANPAQHERTEGEWRAAFEKARAEQMKAQLDWQWSQTPEAQAQFRYRDPGGEARYLKALQTKTDALDALSREAKEKKVPKEWRGEE